MNYKGAFKLKNGIVGEVKFAAENDGDAFTTGCKMFALFDSVEMRIDKMESIFRPKEALQKALDEVERIEVQVKMGYDYARDDLKALSDKAHGYECLSREEVADKLYDAAEYLADVKKNLQESLKLME